MTKFLLDSGNPEEYKEIQALARSHGAEIWGATTNPSLIAKKLATDGKKLTRQEAFDLQKEIVLQIVEIVPGAVSAEVYADHTTTAEDMAEQGRGIASWHPRIIVKLPTTLAGIKARTELRKEGIAINNTLVFSQQQIFTITLHEKIMKNLYGPVKADYPCFISPFIGRLDERGTNGLSLVNNGLAITHNLFEKDLVWMLEASVRNVEQTQGGIKLGSELETIRTTVMRDWFALTGEQQKAIDVASYTKPLQDIPLWTPSEELLQIATVEDLMEQIISGKLDITHPLTNAGIDKFVADWQAILSNE